MGKPSKLNRNVAVAELADKEHCNAAVGRQAAGGIEGRNNMGEGLVAAGLHQALRAKCADSVTQRGAGVRVHGARVDRLIG